MKVVLVSNLYGTLARGGAEKIVELEALALNAAGHEVVVISAVGRASPGDSAVNAVRPSDSNRIASASSTLAFTAEPPVVPGPALTARPRHIVYHPPNICFYADLAKHGYLFKLWWHYFDIFNAPSAARLRRIVLAERPDVVHTHNLMGLGFLIPSTLRSLRVRHVHTVHDVQLLDPSGLLPADREFEPGLLQTIYLAVMRRVMGSPDVVIFPSEFHKRLHERFGFFPRSRRTVVRNPAPAADVAGDAPVSEGRVESSDGQRTYLFVGQLEEHKGIFDLLAAWERASLPNATLEIAGTGSAVVAVAERASRQPNVKMLGRLSGAALDAAYGRADWLVLPSRVIENAPASIAESFARGVPVIASASGGIPEVVRSGETGWTFAPGDVAGLAQTLTAAHGMAEAEHQKMRAGARTAVAGASIEKHLAELLAAYGVV